MIDIELFVMCGHELCWRSPYPGESKGEADGDNSTDIPLRDGDVWVLPDGHKSHVREQMAGLFGGSQVKKLLFVVYNEESLVERRKMLMWS